MVRTLVALGIKYAVSIGTEVSPSRPGARHDNDEQRRKRRDHGGGQAMISLGLPPVRLRREPPFQNNIVVAAQGFRVAGVIFTFFLVFFVGSQFPR